MKKLFLLIFVLLFSAASWADNSNNDNRSHLKYTLNPYAYDLSSTWEPSSQKLHVAFKLNTPPNLNNGTYNDDPYEPNGIQIYAVDSEGKEYRIGGPGRKFISESTQKGFYAFSIDLSSGKSVDGCCPGLEIPRGEPLTWKVRVKGRDRGTYGTDDDWTYGVRPRNVGVTFDKLPYEVTGIAIGTNPYAPNFGKTFVANTDNGKNLQGNATYGWLFDALYDASWMVGSTNATRTPALLEYTAQLKYKARHRKNYHDNNKSWFSSGDFEPHRVRVSEDGRIFVSSYLPGAGWAVAEMIGGDSVVTIVSCDKDVNQDQTGNIYARTDSRFNRRAVDFDVKGSGKDLKILIAWVDPRDRLVGDKYWYAKVECYEYFLGMAEKDGVLLPFPQVVGQSSNSMPNYIKKVAEVGDYNDSDHHGLIFQGYAGPETDAKDNLIDKKTYVGEYYYNSKTTYRAGEYGFIGVSYGKSEHNPIWMKIDFGIKTSSPAHILYFDETGQNPTEAKKDLTVGEGYSTNGFFGGHAIVATEDYLMFSEGRTSSHIMFFKMHDWIDGSTPVKGLLNSDVKTGYMPTRWYVINYHANQNNGTDVTYPSGKEFINGLALDYANNLYITSVSTNKVYTISLPYKGYMDTPAPKGYEFMLPKDDAPVANIYPSKMRYVPAPVNDKYNFSFYANTKPKYAEIRFYRTQEDMKASMATVNDDNFQGDIESSKTDKLYCAYRIPNPKQGLNTVTLAMLGGKIGNDKYLTSAALPAGELYWSVYLETDRSSAFAPIFRQTNSGDDDHHTLHATINNYPETDQFGTIYATSENGTVMKLMQYEIKDAGSDEYSLDNTSRYSLTATNPYANLLNTHPRRMDVDADGMLYMAHEGYIDETKVYSDVPTFADGGIYMWNPNTAINGEAIKLTKFSDNGISTSSAVVLNNHPNDGWRVFATNTYNEFKIHGATNYTRENQGVSNSGNYTKNTKYGWNGFVEYIKDKYTNGEWNWIKYSESSHNWSAKKWELFGGDASGNIALAATDKGLWLCQHREHNVVTKKAIEQSFADNPTSYVLRFVPYNSTQDEVRTWRSCTTDEGSKNSQLEDSPLQATPGGGITWRKINGVDYIYVVNHDGNIVQIKLVWNANGGNISPSVYTPHYFESHGVNNFVIYPTPASLKGVLTAKGETKSADWTTAAISSMCFDYAGNLITTTGVSYETKDNLKTTDAFDTPKDAQNIIVYTMPYNRTNAREIQAPNSCVRIAERLAHTEDAGAMATKVVENKTTYIDLYRPMSNSSFSTICLPFDYDLSELVEGDPYYKATVRAFEGVGLSTIGEEKILELQFGDPVTSIEANIPYIIQPEYNITGIVQIKQQVTLTHTSGGSTPINFNDGEKNNSITFKGVIPMTEIEKSDKTLILVADNRLATVSASGPMYGFRAYFQLASALPKGLKTKLGNKDNTVTGLIDVDGQKVNVEKYLREGRVYIRVGDSLYTIDGQKVE